MPTTVISRREALGRADAVYVGRPTKWGNPFTHKPLGRTRAEHQVRSVEEAVAAFEAHCQHLREAAREELRGRALYCWDCRPCCHAEVLARWADAD